MENAYAVLRRSLGWTLRRVGLRLSRVWQRWAFGNRTLRLVKM